MKLKNIRNPNCWTLISIQIEKNFYYCIHYTTKTPIQYIAGCIQQIGKKKVPAVWLLVFP
jgi:hypothetical protein